MTAELRSTLAILEPMRRPIHRAVTLPTPRGLVIAAVVLGASDWASHLAGDSVLPGGALDECAHLLTMLLVMWAAGPAITRRIAVPALIASVAIDLDHLPQHLGSQLLTAGTPRPYTHSLLTAAAVVLAATASSRRRVLWLGVLAGLLVHFWRDLSEPGAGVSLLWPFSKVALTLPHWGYVLVMAVLVGVVAGRMTATWLVAGHASRHPARS